MNKQEFIDFLKQKQIERKDLSHWTQIYEGCDNHWQLYVPGLDWLSDSIDLTTDDIIEYQYNKSIGSDPEYESIFTSYEDFSNSYYKTVNRC